MIDTKYGPLPRRTLRYERIIEKVPCGVSTTERWYRGEELVKSDVCVRVHEGIAIHGQEGQVR